jgi:hypothetical protein
VPGQSGFARTCGADRAPAKTELGALLGLVHEFPERCSAKYLVTMSRILFRHCEERSDEAIQLVLFQLVLFQLAVQSWIASLRSQ